MINFDYRFKNVQIIAYKISIGVFLMLVVLFASKNSLSDDTNRLRQEWEKADATWRQYQTQVGDLQTKINLEKNQAGKDQLEKWQNELEDLQSLESRAHQRVDTLLAQLDPNYQPPKPPVILEPPPTDPRLPIEEPPPAGEIKEPPHTEWDPGANVPPPNETNPNKADCPNFHDGHCHDEAGNDI